VIEPGAGVGEQRFELGLDRAGREAEERPANASPARSKKYSSARIDPRSLELPR
jgi:hypothetical protein